MPILPPVVDIVDEAFVVERAAPIGRRRGAVVLLPELWGIVPQIRGVASQYAGAGFEVFIPDLLPGTIEPTTDADAVKARYAPADDAVAMKKIAKVVELIRRDPSARGPVIVAGYCYGGRMAMHAAAHVKVDGAVVFYGTFKMPSGKRALNPWQSARDIEVPVQAHYGADDPTIPPEDLVAARQVLRFGKIFVYEGVGHAFTNETRPSYGAEQTRLAWSRVLDFLREREEAWSLANPLVEKQEWELEII